MTYGQITHLVHKFFVNRKHPPQQTDEKEKEYHKRDHWPNGNVVDTLKYILIHNLFVSLILSVSSSLNLDVFSESLQVCDQRDDLCIVCNLDTISVQCPGNFLCLFIKIFNCKFFVAIFVGNTYRSEERRV